MNNRNLIIRQMTLLTLNLRVRYIAIGRYVGQSESLPRLVLISSPQPEEGSLQR